MWELMQLQYVGRRCGLTCSPKRLRSKFRRTGCGALLLLCWSCRALSREAIACRRLPASGSAARKLALVPRRPEAGSHLLGSTSSEDFRTLHTPHMLNRWGSGSRRPNMLTKTASSRSERPGADPFRPTPAARRICVCGSVACPPFIVIHPLQGFGVFILCFTAKPREFQRDILYSRRVVAPLITSPSFTRIPRSARSKKIETSGIRVA